MSEIFAPGSIAGPTGAAGATGPAGPPANFAGVWASGTAYTAGQAVSYTPNGNSYVALTSTTGNEPDTSPAQWGLLATPSGGLLKSAIATLASAALPSFVGQNLFDFSKITPGLAPNGTDGTLIAVGGGATNCTALIYCPGATSMVSDLSVDGGNWSTEGICLYDANGTFISVVDKTEFSSVVNGHTIVGGTAWALPGTQTYVRLGYVVPWLGTNNWTPTESLGRIYATITGTATLPGTYAAGGIETVADVNAKLAARQSNLSTMLSLFGQSILSGPTGGSRNLIDYTKGIPNMMVQSDGTTASTTNAILFTIFCPGATSFKTNLPILPGLYSTNPKICSYDVDGNFIEDITGAIYAQPLLGGITKPDTTYTLSGTQTYIKCCVIPSILVPGGNTYPGTIENAVFYAGTTASPPPSTFTEANWSQPFGTNAPMSVKTATELGAPTDGSNYASTVLNAFLATASSTNPIELVLDGMFNVADAGLVISPNGYTSIRGLGAGTGLFGGGYADMIRIGAYTSGTGDSEGAYNITAPSRSAVNIMLRDFTVNPSGQVNAPANQPATGDPAHPTYPVILANCSNVMIDNLNFPANGANYCITLTNADHVRVTNCVFTTTGTLHDGLHIDGPAEDIGIDNCDFATGDDAIALNAPEGYGGDISRVSITGCRFHNSLSVMRIYTSLDPAAMPTNNVHKTRDVVVSNCTGTISNIAFVLGIENGGLTSTSDADQIQDLSISNCTLSAAVNLIRVRDNIGKINLRGVTFIPTSGNPVFDMAYTVGELSLNDFTILRNPDGNTAPDVVYLNGGYSIDRLSLLNCRVTDEEGSSYTPVSSWVSNNGGTISNLRLEAVDMTHLAALTAGSSWTGFTAVKGAGVLGTGVQVPDSNMDNDAFYLSSTASGALSVKIGGTAKRVTLT